MRYPLFLLLSLFSHLQGVPHLIENVKVNKNVLKIRVNKAFKEEYLKSDFFVRYGSDINLEQFDYSINSMPFIMNVISIVWISGKTYFVKEMDTELYHSLQRIKKVFKTMYPKTSWKGELTVGTLVDHQLPFPQDDNKTALLFSGGIDSVSTAFIHLDKKQLLITAWGHWDLPLGNKNLWQTRSKKIKEFAKQFGNESSIFRSSYTTMLDYMHLSSLSKEVPKWRLGTVEGLGWAGLTAPILLSKGYDTLRIGSSHTWQYPYPSAASPFIDNNLRFCGLKVQHDQFDHTRLMKVNVIHQMVSSLGITPPFLKICSFEKLKDKNCHKCRKCLTTVLLFRVLGIDPKPYGLNYSSKLYKKILEAFKEPKLNYYTILIGNEVQEVIRARIAEDEPVDPELKAFFLRFLKIDFSKAQAFDVKKQQKLDWATMISLLPEDHRLDIPKEYL